MLNHNTYKCICLQLTRWLTHTLWILQNPSAITISYLPSWSQSQIPNFPHLLRDFKRLSNPNHTYRYAQLPYFRTVGWFNPVSFPSSFPHLSSLSEQTAKTSLLVSPLHFVAPLANLKDILLPLDISKINKQASCILPWISNCTTALQVLRVHHPLLGYSSKFKRPGLEMSVQVWGASVPFKLPNGGKITPQKKSCSFYVKIKHLLQCFDFPFKFYCWNI